MKRIFNYLLNKMWFIIISGLVVYWIIDDRRIMKLKPIEHEVGVHRIWKNDSSYVMTTKLDSVYYDPAPHDEPDRQY